MVVYLNVFDGLKERLGQYEDKTEWGPESLSNENNPVFASVKVLRRDDNGNTLAEVVDGNGLCRNGQELVVGSVTTETLPGPAPKATSSGKENG